MAKVASVSIQPTQQPRNLVNRLLINRNFALLWTGQAISRVGDGVFSLTLILWTATVLARNAPWAFFALAGLFFAPSIAVVLVGPFAGVFVDRWDKRRTMLTMDAIRAALIVLLLILSLVPPPYPAGSSPANIFLLVVTYVVLLITSSCGPFFNPSLLTLLKSIVHEEELPKAFGLAELQTNFTTLIGPPVAALLFATFGVTWSFGLNALSFVASFVAVWLIRIPAQASAQQSEKVAESSQVSQPVEQSNPLAKYLREYRQGIRFFVGNYVLMCLVATLIFTTFATAGVTVLNISFVTNNLHVSPDWFPFADAAYGVGAIIGAVALAQRLIKRLGGLQTFWIACIISGLWILLLSRLTNFLLALLVLVLFGLTQGVFNVAFGPLLLKVTPSQLMGRVNSLLSPPITLAATSSIALSVFLVTTVLYGRHTVAFGIPLGPVDVMYVVAGLLVVASGLYAMLSLRHVDLSRYAANATDTANIADTADTAPKPAISRRMRYAPFGMYGIGLLVALAVILPVVRARVALQPSIVLMRSAPGSHPGYGQPIDGIGCASMEGAAEHFHVYMEVFISGQQLTMPAGIGIVAPKQPGVAAITSHGQTTCLYSLHVHQTDNIIHIESPDHRSFNLGEFFDIWGQPLSRSQFAGYSASPGQSFTFKLYDEAGNLRSYGGDPRAISLTGHETIVVLLDSPYAPIQPFTDWNGI